MTKTPNPLRNHLERLRDTGDIETRQLASALVALLDLAEARLPAGRFPAYWIPRVIARYITKEESWTGSSPPSPSG